MATVHQPSLARRVLLVDTDPALTTLFAEWLAEIGCAVEFAPDRRDGGERCDLAVVDLPSVRAASVQRIEHVARLHPGTPILVVSGAILPGVHACGPVARTLGVDCVLAKPLARSTLVDAVLALLAA